MAGPEKIVVLFFILLRISAEYLFAQQDTIIVRKDTALPVVNQVVYERPKNWSFITNVPGDLWQLAKSPFQPENIPGLAIVTFSTGLLILRDQAFLDGARQFASNIHLHDETNYTIALKMGHTKLVKIPNNINTALYQMGEGGTSMLLAGGMFVYGKIKHDYRASQTASDITEAFITTGLATQLLKRCFGRQSPFVSTGSGGQWRPFPAVPAYQKNTPAYDAFPSGHLATVMATVTIFAENYPEKKWIKPVGYSIMGLIGFAMMNTEVHWAGDYPLGIAIGYLSGKITVNRHKKKSSLPKTSVGF